MHWQVLPEQPFRMLSGPPSLIYASQKEDSKPETDYWLINAFWYYFELASGEIKIIAYFD